MDYQTMIPSAVTLHILYIPTDGCSCCLTKGRRCLASFWIWLGFLFSFGFWRQRDSTTPKTIQVLRFLGSIIQELGQDLGYVGKESFGDVCLVGTNSGSVPIGYGISSFVFFVLMWFHVGWVGGGNDGWGRNERRDWEPI